MDIQDLGAIGELVSSIVIGVTLIFLVYEVRATKRTSMEANAAQHAVLLFDYDSQPMIALTVERAGTWLEFELPYPASERMR